MSTDQPLGLTRNRWGPLIGLIVVLSSTILTYTAAHFYIHQDRVIHQPFRTECAFWLDPIRTPLMAGVALAQWGGIAGTILGISQVRTQLAHDIRNLTGRVVLVIVAGWAGWIWGLIVFRELPVVHHLAWFQPIVHDMLGILAITQYVLFWAFLAYAVRSVIKPPILVGGLFIALQCVELFGMALHEPFWEAMMPTAISRLPLALSYPVWKASSWTSGHPSFLYSTPVVTRSAVALYIRPVYAGIIEGLYVGIAVLILWWARLTLDH